VAAIRGDAAEALMLERGADMVRQRGIEADTDLGPIVDPNVTFDGDPQLLQRLRHMYDAGAWVLMESAIADLPSDLRWLFESGAVTLSQLGAIHHALGATTGADLAAAVERHAIRSIAGFDETIESTIAAKLPDLRAGLPRIPLGRAIALVDPIVERIKAAPGVEWVLPAGSLRRGEDTVGDLEIVAASAEPRAIIEELTHLPDAGRTLHRGERRLYLLLDRAQLGLRFPDPAAAGSALWQLTGSVAHVNEMRRLARERHVDLTAPARTEEELYARIDLPFIPAEIRDGADEILAAREGRLPGLVTRADIRGDLHMHTSWSDGRDSVEAMMHACRAQGYEYFAITDHSTRSAASRTLSLDGIKRQAGEIDALRQQFPDITVLHGCEVDIMPDGRLDFADRVLEQFDIVLASLHEHAGHDPAALERRYIGAMKHPLVTLITHPTNRMPPQRKGYDLDYERLFGVAVETGTFLEIDGSPNHLDLDGVLARRAVAAGVVVSVDSDSHRADMVGRQMDLGITIARRGWVEARHVLNARPIAELRSLIAVKRGR
jgi:DNA polymerase (family 10)